MNSDTHDPLKKIFADAAPEQPADFGERVMHRLQRGRRHRIVLTSLGGLLAVLAVGWFVLRDGGRPEVVDKGPSPVKSGPPVAGEGGRESLLLARQVMTSQPPVDPLDHLNANQNALMLVLSELEER